MADHSNFETPHSELLYDLEHLKSITQDDENFLRGLIEIFINTIPQMAEEMKAACADKDWDQISKIAHKLKPTIDAMRIEKIREEIRVIEISTKKNTLEKPVSFAEINTMVENVSAILYKTTDQLKENFQIKVTI